jgi:transposase-like protein
MHIQVSLKLEISATASLKDLEQGIQEAGQQAMREALKQAIRQREDQQVACPSCGHTQRRLEGTVGRVLATVFGRVSVPRRRFRCQDCWRRWCPANRLFVGLGGTTISQPLQDAARLAGSSWPYRVASQLLQKLSGAQISAEEIRLLTNAHGKRRAVEQQAEAEHLCLASSKPASPQDNEKPPMLVGLDGGWVGSREQRGGMEGKVAVVCSQVQDLPMPTYSTTFSWSERGGPRRPPRQRHRLATRRYVATFAPSEQLGTLAQAASQSITDDPSRPVVVIADGAHWIKKQQAQHFSQATCILDWAHLWREIRHAISVAARAKGLSQRERDYQMYLHRTWLWLGGVDHALYALRALATGLPAEPLETVKKAITYLENQRSWIGSYEQWRAQGYPVGSGMIERAVSLVINRRMKKRGMRWKRANATAIVALRTDLLNEDWETPQRLRAFP